jgi:hypothetical protein
LKKNRKYKDISEQCAQFLVDYLNAETYDAAYRGLQISVVEAFNFSIPAHSKSKNKPVPPKWYPYIEESSTNLKELFSDIKQGIRLSESEAFDFFVYCYEKERSVRVDVHNDGSIIDRPVFSERNDEVPKLYAILAYCVITALKSERMRQLICECENTECGRFYIAKRYKKGKGVHKFHSDKCRNRWHYLQKKQSKADKKTQK